MADEHERNRRSAQGDAFAESLKGSARQIWLAGLGALARAQQEGSRLFEALVEEGASLQPQAREGLTRARQRVAGIAAGLSSKASDRFDAMVEDRMAKALERLDVPLGSEVDALAARVEALERTVSALEARAARRRAPRVDAAPNGAPPPDAEAD